MRFLGKTLKNKILNGLLMLSTAGFIIGASATEPNKVSVSILIGSLIYILLYSEANKDSL